MSKATIDKPVQVDICDICGGEITEKQKGDPEEYGRLTGLVLHEPNADATKHKAMKMWWPPSKRTKDMSYNEKTTANMHLRSYDFHADCIQGLVQAAVDLRKKAAEQRASKYDRLVD